MDATHPPQTQKFKPPANASTSVILTKPCTHGAGLDVQGNRVTPGFVSAARRQLSLPFMGHPPILLGTLGMSDSLILMVLALVVFGPRRLPQIGRQIGKLMYEFRKASNDFKFQMEEELRNAEEADRRKKEEERQRSLAAQTATGQASAPAAPSTPAIAIESPYPGEGTYPEQYPPPVSSSEPSSTDSNSAESAPRIAPPSVGETVARATKAGTLAPESTGEVTSSGDAQPEAGSPSSLPAQNPPEAAEALNHHG